METMEMEMAREMEREMEKRSWREAKRRGNRGVFYLNLRKRTMKRLMIKRRMMMIERMRMMKKRKWMIESSEELEKKKKKKEEEHEVEEEEVVEMKVEEAKKKEKRRLLEKQLIMEYENLCFRELTEPVKNNLTKYWEQVVSSGGFDIERCPPDYQCVIRRVRLDHNVHDGDDARNFKVKLYHRLCHLSALALAKYNADNATHFIFSKYLKANQAPCAGTKYYITFEANQLFVDAPPITFQALVYYGIPKWVGTESIDNIQVMLVRQKSSASEKDNPILLSYTE